MHVRVGHIFVCGGVLSVTGWIFCLQVDGPISWRGIIIGSLLYLFFGINFYRMRFRHFC